MYIPVMAFVTYILLSTLLAGLRGAFHPEVMGLTATAAFAIVVIEILGLKFGTYILSISNESQLLDLVAYSGYKFVGVIVTLVVAEILNRGAGTGGWAGWTTFIYTYLANALFLVCIRSSLLIYRSKHDLPFHPLLLLSAQASFLSLTHILQMRSLKYVLLPDPSSSAGAGMQTVARSQRNRRTQFLAFYSCVVQFVFMWILTRQDSMSAKVVGGKT